MRVLIYKRTHRGDPNADGEFGNEGFWGQAHRFPYDIVIGVGDLSTMPVQQELAGKINWIGREPRLIENPAGPRSPLVTFKPCDFRLFEEHGPLLSSLSPILARKVYGGAGGYFFHSFDQEERREVTQIVHLILDLKRFDHLQPSSAIQQAVKCNRPSQINDRAGGESSECSSEDCCCK